MVRRRHNDAPPEMAPAPILSCLSCQLHYDSKALSYNPGLQYPHLHGPVHTPDNNRWDTPPV